MSSQHEETMKVNLQRSVLGMLLFTEHFKTVRQCLEVKMWSGDANILQLVRKAYEYIDLHDKAPGIYTYELIEQLPINSDNQNLLVHVVSNAEIQSRDINVTHVQNQVEKFYRRATLRTTIEKGIELLQTDELDKAEELLMNYPKVKLGAFKPGYSLTELSNQILWDHYNPKATERLSLGIGPLDALGIGPARGELFIVVAEAGGGKTWFLCHIGKRAAMRGFKFVHISLEMNEKLVAARYLMNLYGYSRWQIEKRMRVIIREDGEFDVRGDRNRIILDDHGIEDAIKKLDADGYVDNLLKIKQFPNNTLTIAGLNSYLDDLELYSDFIPDGIILDYGDLMHIKNTDNPRHELAANFGNLRAVAMQRNLMMISACQSNKEGAKSAKIDKTHLSESWHKVAHADNIVSYSSNEAEKEVGLGRLYVAKARNARDQWEMVITQNYDVGQFCGSAIALNVSNKEKMNNAIERIRGTATTNQPASPGRTGP